jgi:hypothetical protein
MTIYDNNNRNKKYNRNRKNLIIKTSMFFFLATIIVFPATSLRVHTRLVPTLLMAMLQPQLLSFLFLSIISLPQRPKCYSRQGIGLYGL